MRKTGLLVRQVKSWLATVIATILFATAAYSFSLFNSGEDGKNIWDEMARHFSIDHYTYKEEVRAQTLWLERHKIYLYRMLKSTSPYIYYVYNQTQAENLPAELALVPLVESSFDPYAHSRAGAVGLWQLMPHTAYRLGITINRHYDGRRDVVASTKAALAYLKYLHDYFDSDWLLAFAAYNSGAGTVDEAIKRAGTRDFFRLGLPQQTRDYVPKILALAAVVQNPGRYEIKLPLIPNKPFAKPVSVSPKTHVATAARKAGINIELMRKLNPGFRYLQTAVAGPHTLLVPAEKAAEFERATPGHDEHGSSDKAKNGAHKNVVKAQLINDGSLRSNNSERKSAVEANKADDDHPENHGPVSIKYQVRPLDTLSSIAERYHVRVDQIKKANQLGGNEIRVGQMLSIPVSSKSANPVLERITYRIRAGDTLGSIADQYNVSVKQIKDWNEIDDARLIRAGQKIKIYREQTS